MDESVETQEEVTESDAKYKTNKLIVRIQVKRSVFIR